jgi:hypothetical protein
MLIDELVPQAVGGYDTLRRRFIAEAQSQGLERDEARVLAMLLPPTLRESECFFDLITNLWRYEFGHPWVPRGAQHSLFGPHVWPLVRHLVTALRCVVRLLSVDQIARYIARLDDPSRHEVVLVEFLPAIRFPRDVTAEFEHRTGAGNRDADWRLTKPGERPILFDVKRRMVDLLHLTSRTALGERRPNGHAPQPEHDPSLLFRSIAEKYLEVDPNVQLQGAWIVTALKQEEAGLAAAFDALDHRRVHFAVLGGWGGGVGLLTRRPEDRPVILERLGVTEARGAFDFVREEG